MNKTTMLRSRRREENRNSKERREPNEVPAKSAGMPRSPNAGANTSQLETSRSVWSAAHSAAFRVDWQADPAEHRTARLLTSAATMGMKNLAGLR